MNTYITVQGDTWDGIAFSQLGSTAYTDRLMMQNPAYLTRCIFPAGIVLTLPEREAEPAVSPTLPPWKQRS